MAKQNCDEMSLAELKAYVLAHRDDDEAWGIYLDKLPRGGKQYPAPLDEESIRIGEEAIREKIEKLGLSKEAEE